jgi:heme A synthase
VKKIITKPQLFFLSLIPIVLIAGLLNKGDNALFIYEDIYIVMDVWYISILSAVFFFLICINYYVLTSNKKPLKSTLTILHIVLQFIVFIPLLYYFFVSGPDYNGVDGFDTNLMISLAFLVFLLATVIHFINFFISLLSKKQ